MGYSSMLRQSAVVSGRCFAAAYLSQFLFHTYSFFSKRFFGKGHRKNQPETFADVLLNEESIRFGWFVGSAAGMFVTMRRVLIARGVGRGLAAAVAGAFAGLALPLDRSEDRRTTTVLYTAVVAADLAIASRGASKSGVRPWAVRNAGALLFVAACYQIMYAWFYHPRTLPSSYCRWISFMSEMDPRVMSTLRGLHHGSVAYGQRENSNVLDGFAEEHGLPPPAHYIAGGVLLPCSPYVHPHSRTCVGNVLRRWRNAFWLSVGLYAPVHIAPLLLMRGRQLSRKPAATLLRAAFSVGRSSTFLATFVALVHSPICFCRNCIFGTDRTIGPALGCALCGFSVFLEKRGRRAQLALFVLPRAVESALRICFGDQGWPWVRSEQVLFSLALATVGAIFERGERKFGRPVLHNALSRMLF